ncbi:MAG: phosphoesterase [Acidobacteria bacterium]|nr:MAG: phosphoesterase [Acidobacteriota bacterium]
MMAGLAASTVSLTAQQANKQAEISLPTGKVLRPVPGKIGSLNSFPATIAMSADGRFAAMLHAGFGTQKSRGCQSISIFDLKDSKVADFPDNRLCEDAHQSYFLGLAFSPDGKHLYASLGALTDPLGSKPGDTGNAIAVYGFAEGRVTPERLIKIAPQKLAEGKWVARGVFKTEHGTAIPYPAGLAIVPGAKNERLLIANNLSDNVILIDPVTGETVKRWDLSTNKLVPSSYPYAVTVSRDGKKAWCSLWNASKVAELDLDSGTVKRWISLREPDPATAAGSHPTALLLTPDEKTLYVALANVDAVAAVSTESAMVKRWFSTELREQKYGGTAPIALAQSPDGSRLFVANANLNAIAVFDVTAKQDDSREDEAAIGFIPTEWYPSAVAVHGDDLLVATAKGTGSGPDSGWDSIGSTKRHREHPYIPTLMYGSLSRLPHKEAEKKLGELTQQVEQSNGLKMEAASIRFHGDANPIKHVIYIIKENRTYDQVFGDLKVGNGDRSLTMYGEDITPNQHKLAMQFGVLDNFYDSGEVSGNGHVWSTAGITSDYNEKVWPIGYRGNERTYDFEGMVADEYPLAYGIPDVDSPGTGYLWANAAEQPSPKEGTPAPPAGVCEQKVVRNGEPLPSVKGKREEASPYPWEIPLIRQSVPTMPELQEHSDLRFAAFNVDYPDQLRVDEFLSEFADYVQGRGQGSEKELPNLVIMHLPNDHTGGTRPGKATPSASVMDNDLAVGRIVEAVSHSPYWDDTAIFVLEDDAQDGADHVDAHRSLALVISKYAPGSKQQPLVDHDFHTTVSMLRTMETLLGLPPMNLNDGYAPVMAKEFSGAGDQPAFTADARNRGNGLLYAVNPAKARGAKQSRRMDFSRPDAADARALNAILWKDRMGKKPMPAAMHTVIPASSDHDDD